VNPYKPPQSRPVQESASPEDLANPTKPLLYFIGGFYAVFSPMLFLTGLQAGPHLMVGALVMLVFGICTIWLGRRPFTSVSRSLTIAWGFIMTLLLVFALNSSRNEADIGGVAVFAVILMIVVPIPIIAFRSQPIATSDKPALKA
jgi:hypothetical protein